MGGKWKSLRPLGSSFLYSDKETEEMDAFGNPLPPQPLVYSSPTVSPSPIPNPAPYGYATPTPYPSTGAPTAGGLSKAQKVALLQQQQQQQQEEKPKGSSQTVIIVVVIGVVLLGVIVLGWLIWRYYRNNQPPEIACDTTEDCADGYDCLEGMCTKKPETDPGTPGAPCNVDEDCSVPGFNLQCVDSICTIPGEGLMESCKISSDCMSFLGCTNGICQFPPKPYVCEVDPDCPPGYVCDGETRDCLPTTGQPCSVDDLCASGACTLSNGGSIFRWSLKYNLGWVYYGPPPVGTNSILDLWAYSNRASGDDLLYILTDLGLYRKVSSSPQTWKLLAQAGQSVVAGSTFVDTTGKAVSSVSKGEIKGTLKTISAMSVSPRDGRCYVSGIGDSKKNKNGRPIICECVVLNDTGYLIFYNQEKKEGLQYNNDDKKFKYITRFSVGDYSTSRILGKDVAPTFILGSIDDDATAEDLLLYKIKKDGKYRKIFPGEGLPEAWPKAYTRSLQQQYNSIDAKDSGDQDDEDVAYFQRSSKDVNFLGQLNTYPTLIDQYTKDSEVYRLSVSSGNPSSSDYVLNGPTSYLTYNNTTGLFSTFYVPEPGLSDLQLRLTGEWSASSMLASSNESIYMVSEGRCK